MRAPRYFLAMADLSAYAREVGLEALTLETMSALAEPPTTRDEITLFMERLNGPAAGGNGGHVGADRVPVYICADTAHGYADESGAVVESNLELFEHAIPWMREFHIKNTDTRFESTFGFGPDELKRGIVDLKTVAELVNLNAGRFPGDEVLGVLELPGPKLGRDYSDRLLEGQFVDSIEAIKRDFLPTLDGVVVV